MTCRGTSWILELCDDVSWKVCMGQVLFGSTRVARVSFGVTNSISVTSSTPVTDLINWNSIELDEPIALSNVSGDFREVVVWLVTASTTFNTFSTKEKVLYVSLRSVTYNASRGASMPIAKISKQTVER